MRTLALMLACMATIHGLRAQERYFLYVQTDNEQAFYAKVQGRTLSSSATGYLILPRITDSVLDLTIGFPKRLHPEQTFRVSGIHSDKGLMLRQLSDKGWGLVDMQSMDVALAISPSAGMTTQIPSSNPSTDPFSELLSTVIGDSTLREVSVVQKEETSSASQPVPPVKTTENVRNTSQANEAVPRKVLPAPEGQKDQTTAPGRTRKLVEQVDTSGVQLIFSDETGREVSDTISVWIPRDKGSGISGTDSRPLSESGAKIAEPIPASTITSAPDRSDCKNFVTVKDLGLLRRRMEAVSDEDAKVAMALRAFKESCFTSEQVRSLLVVFGREEGRFKLLDAAYPHVFDPSRFTALESILKDSYFIYRFRKKTGQTVRQ